LILRALFFFQRRERVEVSPSECWHIGDNLEADFHGSMSAGLKGIWLKRNGIDFLNAVTAIKSLSELKGVTGVHNL
jgi:putative hydrolase of the HAD superfamily